MAATALKDRIRSLRQERGMTLQAVADKLEITPAAVSHWESGRTEPRPEALGRLVAVFGVTLSELRGLGAVAQRRQTQAGVNAEIDQILAAAARQIAKVMGRPLEQVTVSYSVTNRL